MRERTEILIAGGGPGGATAAALLARQGFEVTVLERDRFHRYHIGESLLPSLLPVLDAMGAREVVEGHGFVRKTGAFYGWGGEEWSLGFDEPHRPAPYSFQVVRGEFDHLLLNHARSQGALVRQETSVRQVALPAGRATEATWTTRDGREGTTAFRYFIDAVYHRALEQSPHLTRILAHARLVTPAKVESDYSYVSRAFWTWTPTPVSSRHPWASDLRVVRVARTHPPACENAFRRFPTALPPRVREPRQHSRGWHRAESHLPRPSRGGLRGLAGGRRHARRARRRHGGRPADPARRTPPADGGGGSRAPAGPARRCTRPRRYRGARRRVRGVNCPGRFACRRAEVGIARVLMSTE
ncbi:NAD(P)/FAD-dependent oxidoreductase [Streptomyces bambusae]|uniref:NAD(P)-binding protein n=1 Tax=Streptomyces bambusae TaxID=1550616 RepID=A0ABS6Z605_9ACTN|nr:tryptophan 7-halogenase [Streptomyces bambusae]MBW5482643.1 NAD(P)-binding protein [Streptomyces bambusae]